MMDGEFDERLNRFMDDNDETLRRLAGPNHHVAWLPCDCIYFDIDPELSADDLDNPMCACGHALDEHNEDLECMAEVPPSPPAMMSAQ
jgi:hypothetical protein